MISFKIWFNFSCSNNSLSIVCGDLNYEHLEILYHLFMQLETESCPLMFNLQSKQVKRSCR